MAVFAWAIVIPTTEHAAVAAQGHRAVGTHQVLPGDLLFGRRCRPA